LAWQRGAGGFSRPVVLKRILGSVSRDPEMLQMFIKEARIISCLSHGAITHLHELASESGQLFMVMELVPGGTLVQLARACHFASEQIPVGFSAAVVHEIALALHYAHTYVDAAGRHASVVHRDVAEKNIMVGFDGSVKLLDFGIARQPGQPDITRVGMIKGT